jgi:hypothetical protein
MLIRPSTGLTIAAARSTPGMCRSTLTNEKLHHYRNPELAAVWSPLVSAAVLSTGLLAERVLGLWVTRDLETR